MIFIGFVGSMIVGAVIYHVFLKESRESQTSVLNYVFGLMMEPKFTSVTWEWTDPYVVGESMVFFIKVNQGYLSKMYLVMWIYIRVLC